MRRIAIIGSGIAGLLCAHALVKAGHAVTVFSDRTAEKLGMPPNHPFAAAPAPQ